MIAKVLTLLVLMTPLSAQSSTDQNEWNEGSYSKSPFSYSDILSKEDVRSILQVLKSLSKNEILAISSSAKNRITIKTCSHGTRKPFLCEAGEIFVFEKDKNGWEEKPDERSHWLQ